MSKGKPCVLRADELVLHPELQMRADGTDADHAEDLAGELKKRGGKLPRVRVWEVDGQKLVSDGFHTVTGFKLAGKKVVPCLLFRGTWLDAVIDAAGANLGKTHLAKKKTRRDKQVSLERLVGELRKHGEKWSPARIAEQVGLTDQTVRDFLAALPEESTPKFGSSTANGHDGKTQGKDGKWRPSSYSRRQSGGGAVGDDAPWRGTALAEFLDVEEEIYKIVEADCKTAGELYDALQRGKKWGLPPVKVGVLFAQVSRLKKSGEEQDKAAPAAPVSGKDPGQVWSDFRQHFGPLRRLPDDIGRAYEGEKGSKEYHAAGRLMGELFKVFDEWEKRVAKEGRQ